MRSFIFDDTGTGKTRRAINIMNQYCNSIIVVCPASVRPTWVAQVDQWGDGSQSAVLDGTKGNSRKAFQYFRQSTSKPYYVIVSYDSMARAWPLISRMPKNIHWGVIFDESHYLKNQRSERSKNARKISECAEHMLMLTATPTTKSIEDVYGQCRSMYPKMWERCDHFGSAFKTLGMFRAFYGDEKIIYINGRGVRKYTYSRQSIINIQRIIQSETLPIRSSPVEHGRPLQCACKPPSAEERRVYNQWMDEWTFTDGAMVTARNASEKALKKGQLDDGFIYDESSEPQWFGHSKIDSVWDKAVSLADKTGLPTVIWTRYKASFDFLAKNPLAVPALVLLSQNADVRRSWVKKYKAIIASSKASGTGVDGLQHCACMQIWLDLPYTYAEFYQANSRIDRRGQKNPVRTYIADTAYNHDVYNVVLGREELDSLVRKKQVK